MLDVGNSVSAPMPVLYFVGALVVLASLMLLRVISNGRPGKQPPTLEGFPFVGGIAKFISVCTQLFG